MTAAGVFARNSSLKGVLFVGQQASSSLLSYTLPMKLKPLLIAASSL